MDILYAITIFPIEIIYKQLYLMLYGLVDSFGFALFLLSLLSFFLMKPFERYVGKFQKNEQDLQKVLTPQLAQIKLESQGAERHQRITNLYKRYSYHPIFSIRASVGLLVQVPFLVAAYFMLSNLPLIQGQSLWFIHDLSKPDGLLAGINLLPFVMTLVNCISVYYYPSEGGQKAKLQLYGMAVFFLVILYGASSALIIYWTFNNLLSLIRNLLQRRALLPFAQYAATLSRVSNTIFKRLELKNGTELLFLYSTVFLLAPSIVVVSNKEYSLGAEQYLSMALFGFVLLYLFCVLILRTKFKVLQVIFFIAASAGLYVFISTTIYPFQTGVLDGEVLNFSIWDIRLHAFLFLTCFLVYYSMRNRLRQTFKFLGLIIFFFAFVTCLDTYQMGIEKSQGRINIKEFSELGTKENVIILGFDSLQGVFAEQILAENKELHKVFDGFTFFNNTVSPSSYTNHSLYPLIAGEITLDKESDNIYQYVSQGDNIFSDAHDSSFRAVTNINAVRKGIDHGKNGLFIKRNFFQGDKAGLFFISLLRYFPFQPESNPKEFGWMSKKDEKKSLDLFFENIIVNESLEKSFIFYFSVVSHFPVRFNRDGIFSSDYTINDSLEEQYLAFNYMEKLIEKLKKQGVYDKTTIVFFGDHGSTQLRKMTKVNFKNRQSLLATIDDTVMFYGQYDIALFVKPSQSRGLLKESSSPVSLLDIRKTLSSIYKRPNSSILNGYDVFESDIPKDRKMPVFVLTKQKDLSNPKRFLNLSPWSIKELSLPLESNFFSKVIKASENIKFNSFNNNSFLSENWSGTESWGTWSDGKSAVIELPLAKDVLGIQLDARVALFSNSFPLAISFNGIEVFNKEVTMSKLLLNLDIPESVLTQIKNKELLKVEFNMPNATSPAELGRSTDTRVLGIGLHSITPYSEKPEPINVQPVVTAPEPEKLESVSVAPLSVNSSVVFNATQANRSLLVEGWSGAEEWGTWSDGKHAVINLPLVDDVRGLSFKARVALFSKAPFPLSISFNGVEVYNKELTTPELNLNLDIPEGVLSQIKDKELLKVEFNMPNVISPAELGLSSDTRSLGIALASITPYSEKPEPINAQPETTKPEPEKLELVSVAPLTVNSSVVFNTTQTNRPLLTEGWSGAEEWGTWSDGVKANIITAVEPNVKGIKLHIAHMLIPSNDGLNLTVTVNGAEVLAQKYTQQVAEIDIPLPQEALNSPDNIIDIELHMPNVVSPKELGHSEDTRKLGIGLKEISAY